jgi:hypothetical protein
VAPPTTGHITEQELMVRKGKRRASPPAFRKEGSSIEWTKGVLQMKVMQNL